MNIDKLSTSISLLANIGVLAGIVFLAFEISQNTNMMRSQTRDAITEKQVDYFFTLGGSLETAALFDKGSKARSELSDAEGIAFFYLNQGIFRIWENEFYQYQSGLFEDSEFEPRLNAWRGLIVSNPGSREIWESTRAAYSPEFVEILDRAID